MKQWLLMLLAGMLLCGAGSVHAKDSHAGTCRWTTHNSMTGFQVSTIMEVANSIDCVSFSYRYEVWNRKDLGARVVVYLEVNGTRYRTIYDGVPGPGERGQGRVTIARTGEEQIVNAVAEFPDESDSRVTRMMEKRDGPPRRQFARLSPKNQVSNNKPLVRARRNP